MTTEEIQTYIRDRRLSLGLSCRAVGELCGYEGHTADRTLQRWEAGERPIPVGKFRKLAAALDIDVRDLIPD